MIRELWFRLFPGNRQLPSIEIKEDVVTYSEFYTAPICPKCKHILDHDKARYKTKCCYLCGHTNGYLFTTWNALLQDKYLNGKFFETIVHKENKYMKALLILPFLIELFGDYYLISKRRKDISIWWRTVMILVFSGVCLAVPGDYLNNVIIAIVPYALFDPALNLLRGKKLTYNGKTKMYDKFLAKFPNWVVLVARIVFVAVLLIFLNA